MCLILVTCEVMIMGEKILIERGSIQETLIIPLYARKKCSDKFPELYYDSMASNICEHIDYDFSELDKSYEKATYEFGAMEGAMRQMDMLWEIKDYLKEYPKASIVCMGCGLDFDPRRCGDEHNKIYYVDFPNVIAIREKLVERNEREINIAADLTDLSWLDKVDGSEVAILYAAGVFHYLKTEEVKNIVMSVEKKLPNARLVFDIVGKIGYKIMMKTVLKNHKMNGFGELFHTGNAVRDLSGWSNSIRVSSRGYMLGYYDMKSPGVRGIHRIMAKICDNIMKMQIVRIDVIRTE